MASSEKLTSKHNDKSENEDIDFWNDVLPEELVSHILSFLPTKEAIKTSVLSKRWKDLWTTTISNLDFSDFRAFNVHWLVADVNDVMSRLKANTSIDKLYIPLKSFEVDDSQIKKWISFAVKRHVKDLTLSRELDEYYYMDVPRFMDVPRNVFACKSLEKLELCNLFHLKIPQKRLVCFPNLEFLCLESVSISGIPDEENSPCFPKLKKLRLDMVTYDGKDNSVMKLIRNCPLLDDLSIHRDLNYNVSNDDMCIPQLTNAELKCPSGADEFNVEIEAPIKYLAISNWNWTSSYRIIVKNQESLIKARLSFSYYGEQLLKLLKTVDKVKYLSLAEDYPSRFFKHSNIRLPLFSNLIRLEVVLGCNNFCTLEGLLQSTINLQTLVIHNYKVKYSAYSCTGCKEKDGPWTKSYSLPKCLRSSLKRVEIIDLTDCPVELEMIQVMLRFAKVLELLTTKWLIPKRMTAEDYTNKIDLLRRKISTFRRASASCRLDFPS